MAHATLTLTNLSASFPYPLSYEFQVVEYTDSSGAVVKVELQSKENQHDQHGNIVVHGTWVPVPRVKLPMPYGIGIPMP